jgi:vibriolysin
MNQHSNPRRAANLRAVARAFTAVTAFTAFATVGAQAQQEAGPTEAVLIDQHTDASGKLTVALFEQVAPAPVFFFTDFSVVVPPDYVVIGGGVEGAELPVGHLLTASYPNADLSAWLVSTKDHLVSNPARIKAWAIGLKIVGLTRKQVRKHVRVTQAIGGLGPFPEASVAVRPGFTQIGGGFRINWTGAGNLGTASYPVADGVWRAAGKDHLAPSPATAQAYSIGLRNSIPGVGDIVGVTTSQQSPLVAHPRASAFIASGYALSGCGALVNWTGAGNLLWMLKPVAVSDFHGCEAASKDHEFSSPATIRTFAMGIRVQ